MYASLTTHLTNQRLANLRKVLNYQFTPKNNEFTQVILFIVIIIPFFIIIISLTKVAILPYTNLSFSARVSLNYYSNNVKLLSLSNNKMSLTEK